MSTRYLKRFFKPRSIAVFGASERPDSLGGAVLGNLLQGGFQGQLMAVNPQGYDSVQGVPCYQNLSQLPEMPDLAVIATPPDSVPHIIRKLGASEVHAALVLTSSRQSGDGEAANALGAAILEAAHPYAIRILGPDALGLLVPSQHINASYSHLDIKPGKVAYVGQSGILGTAMIDWANGQDIGFSAFVTLGQGVDVDLPSIIDYLADDPHTRAILIQLDSVRASRHFISALRAAARNKLVLVLKSNIGLLEGSTEALLPPGIQSIDRVYDTVLNRVGVLRVSSTDELFDALETLTTVKPLRGYRLAIVGNGTGPNAMAAERLLRHQGKLARLTEPTLEALAEALPEFCCRTNPVDLNVDATPARFARAVEILIRDDNVDAVLVVHAPTRLAGSVETAKAVIKVATSTRRNVLTSWMGRSTAIEARNLCNDAKVPTFITPEKAVEAFMHMVDYRRNQDVMRETPAALNLDQNRQNRERGRELVQKALDNERDYLRHEETCTLLDCYNLPVASTFYATEIEGVVDIARHLGGAVAVKALHQDNRYPFSYDHQPGQRWRDLALDLYSVSEVRHAVTKLAYRVGERYGEGEMRGYCVQQMKRGFQSLQISTGITRDPVFGPMIFFGAGGYSNDVLEDRQLMLPPLNESLAQVLLKRSRVYRFLKQNSYRFQEDVTHLCELLVRLSQLIVDLPRVEALEINPLLVNKRGLLAVDACVSLAEAHATAIAPYPDHLAETARLKRSGREVLLRPIRGEDETNHLEFFKQLSPDTIRLRYFYSRGKPSHNELANWTQIDYDREMAFIATAERTQGQSGSETLGVVRTATDPDNIRAEFAVVIRDDLQGEGLGVMLMEKMIRYCRSRGTLQIMGTTLPTNQGMQKLARKLGFENRFNMEEEVVEMNQMLNEPTEDWQITRLKNH